MYPSCTSTGGPPYKPVLVTHIDWAWDFWSAGKSLQVTQRATAEYL